MISRFTIEATCTPDNAGRLVKLVKGLADKYDAEFALETVGGATLFAIRATFVGDYDDLEAINIEWTLATRVVDK